MSLPHLITRAGAVIAACSWLIEYPQRHLAKTSGTLARAREFTVGNNRYAMPVSPCDPCAVYFTTTGRIAKEAGLPVYHSVPIRHEDHIRNTAVTGIMDEYLQPLGLSSSIIEGFAGPPATDERVWTLETIRQRAIDATVKWCEEA